MVDRAYFKGLFGVGQLFEGCVLINLDSQPERLERTVSELKPYGLEDCLTRLSAFGHENRTYGRSVSHLDAVRLARRKGWRSVLILEDDIKITGDFAEHAPNALRDLADRDWGAFQFGAIPKPGGSEFVTPHLFRYWDAASGHAVALHRRAYDFVIDRYICELDRGNWDEPAHYPFDRFLGSELCGSYAVYGPAKPLISRHAAPPGGQTAQDDGRDAIEGAGPLAETARARLPDPRQISANGFNHLYRCRHGVMLFNHNDVYIGRSLELYGEWSEAEPELFRRFVRPGDVVVEAGANIGAHTLALAQQVGEAGTVYAFEPQRIAFQTLCANVALNSLTNIHCRQQALGAGPGEIVVPQLDLTRRGNFGRVSLGHHKNGETVPVVTIDSLELPRCRLIKVDVEGMEQSVLEGASATIQKYRPVLYVENDRRQHSAALIRCIMSLGYRLYWHYPPIFNEDNWSGNPTNAFGKVVSVNMICVDADSDIRFEGLKPVESPGGD